jgi:serine protease Do
MLVTLHNVRLSVKTSIAALILLCAAVSFAAAVKDREGAVRTDRATMENDARWLYNNIQGGLEKAKQTGKPLLVVLRCVPCLSCAGIDASVLTEPSLAPLLDKFVCVRVINANALDLSLFQFDYDLSFSALFFNADRTIYGRYGSWKHQKDPADKTTAGFKRALEAALAIHEKYPGNKSSLAGKQGAQIPFVSPIEIPSLAGKYKPTLNWDGKVVPSCVHCHQIGEAYRETFRADRKSMPSELIYPMPPPETIGITLAADHVARVESVAANSIAARAGMKPGDDVIALAGQPLISIADFAWALHRTSDFATLKVTVRRGSAEKEIMFELPAGWRGKADIARRVGTWQMRGMAFGGLVLEDLADDERATRKVPADSMALFVKHVGEYGKHAAAKRAGFQKSDVIVQLGDNTKRVSEGELIGQLLQKHQAGEKLNAAVLRGDQRVELKLPMQ